MGVHFKYNPGDIVNQCEMISRDYKDERGNWYCTFKCLDCGEIFQNRLKRVFNENVKNCSCHDLSADLKGVKKGALEILEKAPKKTNDRNAYWKCKCDCGKIFEISTTDFNRHQYKTCPHESNGGRPIQYDLTNKQFGKLKVLKYLGNQYWECQCSCGNIVQKRRDVLLEQRGLACPNCLDVMSTGETIIHLLLNQMNIKHNWQQTFDSCRFPKTNGVLRFDFYLSDYQTAIEFNGEQHYQEMEWVSDTLEEIQARDKFKINWCKEHNIKIIVIPYTDLGKINEQYIKQILQV